LEKVEIKNKIKSLKPYFLILNLVLGIVAFSFLISAQCPPGGCGNSQNSEDVGVSEGGSYDYSNEIADSGMTNTPLPGQSSGGYSAGSGDSQIFDGSFNYYSGPGNSPSNPSAPYNIEGGNFNSDPFGYSSPQQGGQIPQNPTPIGGCGGGGCEGQIEQVPGPQNTLPGEPKNIPLQDQTKESLGKGIGAYLDGDLLKNLGVAAGIGGLGAMIGGLAGGEKGQMWGFASGFAGAVTYQLLKAAKVPGTQAALFGLGVAVVIFLLTYKKKVEKIVEFKCLPWQAPIGGADCELCNDYEECNEYTCKSLGQACGIINEGSEEQKCVWLHPYDVNGPTLEMKEVNKGHKYKPDNLVAPPGKGVEITRDESKCIKAFTPLEFKFVTDEPAQCKIDYNITNFESMNYYVGGNSLFVYNHTETLSLPGPDTINAVAPELQNDGTYTLYIACQDANGNKNERPFSVRFCVEEGPDTTPPLIVDVNIPSGNPIQFNQTSLDLEVYVNEPSECKWSREDRPYENMENDMVCATQLWEINNQNVYTCKTLLTGIEDRKTNEYYFRCKDQPWAEEGDRNENKQSYLYTVVGTQPLSVLGISPESGDVVSGATDVIPVFLEIKTDNGYNNGEAKCYFSLTNDEAEYIEFSETGANLHKQRQDLSAGEYEYYFKCLDLGGNAVYNSTRFKVETDRTGPNIVRVYKESGELKIITDESAECSYSVIDCNFEIDDGIKMSSLNYKIHNAEWIIDQKYYIRCKDKYNNQPDPNRCSIVVSPTRLKRTSEVVEL
jgi:hypothetical protein